MAPFRFTGARRPHSVFDSAQTDWARQPVQRKFIPFSEVHLYFIKIMSIILTPFERALMSLEEVLVIPKTSIVRDSAIQRFEYTYELGMKMLKRHLEEMESVKTTVDELGFKDFIRLAAEKGYMTDPEVWFAYRESRNITSHAYDEKKAESIYAILPAFAKDARLLFLKLKQAQGSL